MYLGKASNIVSLTTNQTLVLEFLEKHKEFGTYSARDIHENVFGRCKSIHRGLGAVKTNNILRALINRELVTRRFASRYMYQINSQKVV